MTKAAIFTPLLIVAGYLRLVAQADPPILGPGLSSLIGNVGVIGVLIWFLWYNTTKSQPNMIHQFAAELQRLREERRLEREGDERDKAELRKMLFDSLQSDRRAVHDVRDTAQAAINKLTASAEAKPPKTGS